MIVADAFPLIVLAKLQRLKLLNDLYGEVLIGSVVKAETIDTGQTVRAQGVEQLEAALGAGWLQTVHVTALLWVSPAVVAEVLRLAREANR